MYKFDDELNHSWTCNIIKGVVVLMSCQKPKECTVYSNKRYAEIEYGCL